MIHAERYGGSGDTVLGFVRGDWPDPFFLINKEPRMSRFDAAAVDLLKSLAPWAFVALAVILLLACFARKFELELKAKE